MISLLWIVGFLFAAPTMTRVRKDPNWFLAIVYLFLLAFMEFVGSFSALGDVPKAQSLFPNIAPGDHCGFSWWYDHMGICLVPLVTNTLSLAYECLRWSFWAPIPTAEALAVKKDPPGNFEEMWQRIRDCETISEDESRDLYVEVITLLKEKKVSGEDAMSLARCVHNGRAHTVEMETSAAKEAPLMPDTRESSGF